MGYLVAFGLVLFGYTLIDWGHYIRRHENVNVWYLISGMGQKYGAGTPSSFTQPIPRESVNLPIASAGNAAVQSAQGASSAVISQWGIQPTPVKPNAPATSAGNAVSSWLSALGLKK